MTVYPILVIYTNPESYKARLDYLATEAENVTIYYNRHRAVCALSDKVSMEYHFVKYENKDSYLRFAGMEFSGVQYLDGSYPSEFLNFVMSKVRLTKGKKS